MFVRTCGISSGNNKSCLSSSLGAVGSTAQAGQCMIHSIPVVGFGTIDANPNQGECGAFGFSGCQVSSPRAPEGFTSCTGEAVGLMSNSRSGQSVNHSDIVGANHNHGKFEGFGTSSTRAPEGLTSSTSNAVGSMSNFTFGSTAANHSVTIGVSPTNGGFCFFNPSSNQSSSTRMPQGFTTSASKTDGSMTNSLFGQSADHSATNGGVFGPSSCQSSSTGAPHGLFSSTNKGVGSMTNSLFGSSSANRSITIGANHIQGQFAAFGCPSTLGTSITQSSPQGFTSSTTKDVSMAGPLSSGNNVNPTVFGAANITTTPTFGCGFSKVHANPSLSWPPIPRAPNPTPGFDFSTTPLCCFVNYPSSNAFQPGGETPTNFPSFRHTLSLGSRVATYLPSLNPDFGFASGLMQSISAMPAYEGKSHEELRWEDYQLQDKAKDQTTPASEAAAINQRLLGLPVLVLTMMPNFNFDGCGVVWTPTIHSGTTLFPASQTPFGATMISGTTIPLFPASQTPIGATMNSGTTVPLFPASQTPPGATMNSVTTVPLFPASQTPPGVTMHSGGTTVLPFAVTQATLNPHSANNSASGQSPPSLFASTPFVPAVIPISDLFRQLQM